MKKINVILILLALVAMALSLTSCQAKCVGGVECPSHSPPDCNKICTDADSPYCKDIGCKWIPDPTTEPLIDKCGLAEDHPRYKDEPTCCRLCADPPS